MPLAGWVTESIVIPTESASMSLASTSIAVAAASSATVAAVVDRDRVVGHTGHRHADTVAVEPPLSV